jgi:hypothetical protein
LRPEQPPHQRICEQFGFDFYHAVKKSAFQAADRLGFIDRGLANDASIRQVRDPLDRIPVIGGSIAQVGSYSNKGPIGHPLPFITEAP